MVNGHFQRGANCASIVRAEHKHCAVRIVHAVIAHCVERLQRRRYNGKAILRQDASVRAGVRLRTKIDRDRNVAERRLFHALICRQEAMGRHFPLCCQTVQRRENLIGVLHQRIEIAKRLLLSVAGVTAREYLIVIRNQLRCLFKPERAIAADAEIAEQIPAKRVAVAV